MYTHIGIMIKLARIPNATAFNASSPLNPAFMIIATVLICGGIAVSISAIRQVSLNASRIGYVFVNPVLIKTTKQKSNNGATIILPLKSKAVSFQFKIDFKFICTPMANNASGVAVCARLLRGINNSSGSENGMSRKIKPHIRDKNRGLLKRRMLTPRKENLPFPLKAKIIGAKKAKGIPVTN